ncbi:hypothetical protein [Paenisporosarcina antarctica]|uniref:Spore coat protein n=1 Tax=Paenisporosarcina antarctica TaxID=417367 RepID=A0A4P6ZXV6_9BACL|nr:hypothetical protein [Paenisporosarcina antarctica]QBP41267.1 hypothetical protein E2636_09010 [Paenisporosarcina antarctica]
MNLPAVDLGIMAEHLTTHEGVINRLKMYNKLVRNHMLKKLLDLHLKTLRNHVKTMLALIEPGQTHQVHLPKLDSFNWDVDFETLEEYEKDIALDTRSTAKLMGSDNFNSALMMKDSNVKNIHIKMAYQNVSMQMMYDHLIMQTQGEFIPRVSNEMQQLTLKHYYHVQNE